MNKKGARDEAATEAGSGDYLSIYQYRGGELVELTEGGVSSAEGTAALFERLGRIFGVSDGFPPDYGVLVELTVNHDLDDRKIVMTAAQGEWLLGVFLKVPRSQWARKLKGGA